MIYKYLNSINSPLDIKKMGIKQLDVLCSEIREYIIDTVARNGGHLSPNLGTVELSVALHKVFDCPEDEFIWDVGHQSYTHKIITGRRENFVSLRTEGGISGFSRPSESKYDSFIAGHAGISLSAAYGKAVGKRLRGEKGHAIAIAGDGAISNGMIYEALNNAGRSKEKLILIINDNNMSISKNVGAMSKHLAAIRSSKEYFTTKDVLGKGLDNIPLIGKPVKIVLSASKTALKHYLYQSNFFENFGFTYLGPVDGHNIDTLCQVLNRARSLNKPVVIHVNTKKGKGYLHAQDYPGEYHGVSSFNRENGIDIWKKTDNFSSVFGSKLTELANKDESIIAVTSAMCDGTGLNEFSNTFKKSGRFFDTGIAEGHTVTFCAGLASSGIKPVFAVYSTFLQRAYDQLIHDCSIEKQHIILGVDRAGIVGEDGETHQGIFDVAMIRTIPNSTIYSPSTYSQLEIALEKALTQHDSLTSVRYPRGKEGIISKNYISDDVNYSFYNGDKNVVIISYGRLWEEVVCCVEKLKAEGINISALNLTRVHPIDINAFKKAKENSHIFFYEEGIKKGGAGECFGSMLIEHNYKGFYHLNAIDGFVPQATVKSALSKLGLDCNSMYNDIKEHI